MINSSWVPKTILIRLTSLVESFGEESLMKNENCIPSNGKKFYKPLSDSGLGVRDIDLYLEFTNGQPRS